MVTHLETGGDGGGINVTTSSTVGETPTTAPPTAPSEGDVFINTVDLSTWIWSPNPAVPGTMTWVQTSSGVPPAGPHQKVIVTDTAGETPVAHAWGSGATATPVVWMNQPGAAALIAAWKNRTGAHAQAEELISADPTTGEVVTYLSADPVATPKVVDEQHFTLTGFGIVMDPLTDLTKPGIALRNTVAGPGVRVNMNEAAFKVQSSGGITLSVLAFTPGFRAPIRSIWRFQATDGTVHSTLGQVPGTLGEEFVNTTDDRSWVHDGTSWIETSAHSIVPWQANHSYNPGDIVYDDGFGNSHRRLFVADQTISSTSSTHPGTTSGRTSWDEIGGYGVLYYGAGPPTVDASTFVALPAGTLPDPSVTTGRRPITGDFYYDSQNDHTYILLGNYDTFATRWAQIDPAAATTGRMPIVYTVRDAPVVVAHVGKLLVDTVTPDANVIPPQAGDLFVDPVNSMAYTWDGTTVRELTAAATTHWLGAGDEDFRKEWNTTSDPWVKVPGVHVDIFKNHAASRLRIRGYISGYAPQYSVTTGGLLGGTSGPLAGKTTAVHQQNVYFGFAIDPDPPPGATNPPPTDSIAGRFYFNDENVHETIDISCYLENVPAGNQRIQLWCGTGHGGFHVDLFDRHSFDIFEVPSASGMQ